MIICRLMLLLSILISIELFLYPILENPSSAMKSNSLMRLDRSALYIQLKLTVSSFLISSLAAISLFKLILHLNGCSSTNTLITTNSSMMTASVSSPLSLNTRMTALNGSLNMLSLLLAILISMSYRRLMLNSLSYQTVFKLISGNLLSLLINGNS